MNNSFNQSQYGMGIPPVHLANNSKDKDDHKTILNLPSIYHPTSELMNIGMTSNEEAKRLRDLNQAHKKGRANNPTIGSFDLRPIDSHYAQNKPEKGRIGVSVCVSKEDILFKNKPSI